MTDYPYNQIFAADPSTPGNVAAYASILIFAPGDETKTPIVLMKGDGSPLDNPLTTSGVGATTNFIAQLEQVAWEGGGYSGFFESFVGMRDETQLARIAAQSSANDSNASKIAAEAAAGNAAEGAVAGVQEQLAATVAEAEDAKVAAQQAAALVGAPAGDAVVAAIQPGGAAHGVLNAAIGAQVDPLAALSRLAPMLQPRTIPAMVALALAYSADASPIIANSVTWGVLDGPVDLLSCIPMLTAAGELDSGYVRNTSGRIDTDANRAVYGIEWVADGNTELRFRAFYTAVKFRLYVDDVPAQTDIQTPTGVTLSGGTNFRVGVTHPNPGVTRRFRLMVAGGGLRAIYTAPTTSIYAPKVKRIKVAIVGTSFSDNSGSVALLLDSWVWLFAERYGVEVLNCAQSGSGYVGTSGPTHMGQVPIAIAWKPDLTIAEGSGNDVSANGTDIQTAAAAAFAALEATGTPVVAVGMLPRGASGETSGTAAKVITYTKAAAEAAPNVLGYIDTIGTMDPLPVYATGAAYAVGAKVGYLGTTWQARVAISSAPATFDRAKWKPLSWNFGTGRVGTATGDGNRDITVQADDLHPTAVGSGMIAANIGPRIVSVLAQATVPDV